MMRRVGEIQRRPVLNELQKAQTANYFRCMAKTQNPMRISGTIGGVSFVKHPVYGWYVREKGGPTANDIFNKPSFAKTRENISRFGTASRYGKHLRSSLAPLTRELQDTQYQNRVQKAFSEIILRSEDLTHDALLKHMHLLNRLPVNEGNTVTQLHVHRPVVHTNGLEAAIQVSVGSAPLHAGDICAVRAMTVKGNIVQGNWRSIGACEVQLSGICRGDVRSAVLEIQTEESAEHSILCVTVQFFNTVNGNVCWFRDQQMYAGMMMWVE